MKKQECNKCKILKNITDFEHQKNRPNPRKTCKKCRAKNRVYTESQRKSRRKYAENLRKKEGFYEKQKNYQLKKNYNIDLFYFNEMLNSQKNKCAICKNDFKNNKNIHVDHNHTTGVVRELLCSKCNSAIGLLNEDIKTIKNAIMYLKKHNN